MLFLVLFLGKADGNECIGFTAILGEMEEKATRKQNESKVTGLFVQMSGRIIALSALRVIAGNHLGRQLERGRGELSAAFVRFKFRHPRSTHVDALGV
jgi:hypothetical protein